MRRNLFFQFFDDFDGQTKDENEFKFFFLKWSEEIRVGFCNYFYCYGKNNFNYLFCYLNAALLYYK